jgi:hypothetical protein
VLEQNRHTTALKIEGDLIDLCPSSRNTGRMFEYCSVEWTSQATFEMAVKPGEFKHTLAVGAGKRDMPDQCDLGFGKRAGLVGA